MKNLTKKQADKLFNIWHCASLEAAKDMFGQSEGEIFSAKDIDYITLLIEKEQEKILNRLRLEYNEVPRGSFYQIKDFVLS